MAASARPEGSGVGVVVLAPGIGDAEAGVALAQGRNAQPRDAGVYPAPAASSCGGVAPGMLPDAPVAVQQAVALVFRQGGLEQARALIQRQGRVGPGTRRLRIVRLAGHLGAVSHSSPGRAPRYRGGDLEEMVQGWKEIAPGRYRETFGRYFEDFTIGDIYEHRPGGAVFVDVAGDEILEIAAERLAITPGSNLLPALNHLF